ncbi:hypothetical protein [Bacillus pumilus]|uniref:hypothetical protein n=1 Tax=Bacillus pumilus TaxID=1408 RepID=UPI001C21471E|nr:hypothetical protein [Bacillus pumilus]MBU8573675.1 hypothetical protein [Bacillus pumilus]
MISVLKDDEYEKLFWEKSDLKRMMERLSFENEKGKLTDLHTVSMELIGLNVELESLKALMQREIEFSKKLKNIKTADIVLGQDKILSIDDIQSEIKMALDKVVNYRLSIAEVEMKLNDLVNVLKKNKLNKEGET